METPAAALLALEGVSRHLAGRPVVTGLDLAVAQGEVLGLLGINGAGKTTTLRMMAGELRPSAGVIRIDGTDLAEEPGHARRRIGYLPETPPLYPELTVSEFLGFCARLHGVSRRARAGAVDAAIATCNLGDVARRVIGTLSRGYRQRVGLAQAIVHQPDVIVLDEPATGLDPAQSAGLRDIVRTLGKRHAVVLSSHVLADVAACCDRVAILHEGTLRYTGAPTQPGGEACCMIRVGTARRREDWLALDGVAAAAPVDARTWRITLTPPATAETLATAAVAHGFGLAELRPAETSLETFFLELTGAARERAA